MPRVSRKKIAISWQPAASDAKRIQQKELFRRCVTKLPRHNVFVVVVMIQKLNTGSFLQSHHLWEVAFIPCIVYNED